MTANLSYDPDHVTMYAVDKYTILFLLALTGGKSLSTSHFDILSAFTQKLSYHHHKTYFIQPFWLNGTFKHSHLIGLLLSNRYRSISASFIHFEVFFRTPILYRVIQVMSWSNSVIQAPYTSTLHLHRHYIRRFSGSFNRPQVQRLILDSPRTNIYHTQPLKISSILSSTQINYYNPSVLGDLRYTILKESHKSHSYRTHTESILPIGCFSYKVWCPISCHSKKQKTIALRTFESEYLAASHSLKERVWFQKHSFGPTSTGTKEPRSTWDIQRSSCQDSSK